MSLVEIIDLQLSTEQARLFRELTQFYIQSRYPEEETLAGNVHGDRAQEVLRKTEEAVSWLSSML